VIRALFFDFDGLITDTESADYEAWRSVYADHGVVLPLERWLASIGSDGSSFVPLDHLRELVGALDEEAVTATRRARLHALFAELRPLPGVVDWLREAREHGLHVGVVSSSSRAWVDDHLERLGLAAHVDFRMTRDDVSRVKPHPDLYLRALAHVGVEAAHALAVEDSPNGLRAARAAGLACVAVPGPMTRGLVFESPTLVLESLAERPLASVIAQIQARQRQALTPPRRG
jgi:HAD superfamily hydrolase (TIGR01509 family)